MAGLTWEFLEKNQNNPEKIEQAIARLIAEHNNDETAHLGVGQSLQSHKASEIIDHLAKSIIYDKIKEFNVGIEQFYLNKHTYSEQFDNISSWEFSGDGNHYVGPGNMRFWLNTTDKYKEARRMTSITPIKFANKNPCFECVFYCNNISNVEYIFGIGSGGTDFLGFKLSGGVMAGEVWRGWGHYTFDFDQKTWTSPHFFRARLVNSNKIEFYIDNVIVYSGDFSCGSFETSSNLFDFYGKNLNTVAKNCYFYSPKFFQDV